MRQRGSSAICESQVIRIRIRMSYVVCRMSYVVFRVATSSAAIIAAIHDGTDHATYDIRANQLIQFVPASRFHFVVIFFDCVQNSIEPRPVMSPTPKRESFQPPKENGSRGTGTPTFTPTIPALACSITYRATPPLSVNTDAAFP